MRQLQCCLGRYRIWFDQPGGGMQMFKDNYLEKLKKYIGKDIKVLDTESEVQIYVDAEIQYFLRKKEQQYVLVMQERGRETEERTYRNEIEMRRNFALLMKNVFTKGIEYRFAEKFRNVENITVLKELMRQYTNENLYAVNDLKEDKININENENGLYNILFLDKNGNRYILEQNRKAPFVLKRFYNEVVYYGETLKQIQEYEKVFEDKLDYNMKIEMLGY